MYKFSSPSNIEVFCFMKLEKKQQGKIYFIDIWRFKSASLFLFALVSSDASEELVSLYDYDVKIKISLFSN